MGGGLANGLREAFDEVGMAGQVTGVGSMLNVRLTPHPVADYRSAAAVRNRRADFSIWHCWTGESSPRRAVCFAFRDRWIPG